MQIRLTDFLVRISLFFLIGLGVFYNSSKFNVPLYGSNDFYEYSLMVENPFQGDATTPFRYRIITPLVAHIVYKNSAYYRPTQTVYGDKFNEVDEKKSNKNILNALIFTNYLFLVLSAYILSLIVEKIISKTNLSNKPIYFIGLPSLLFASLSTISHSLGGTVDGGSIFFITLLLYALLEKHFILFGIAVIISILQREIIPLIFIIYLISHPRKNITPIIFCLTAFLCYLVIKNILFPVSGYLHQTSPYWLMENFKEFQFNREYFLQGYVANNVVAFGLLFSLYYRGGMNSIALFTPYFLVSIFLIFLSIATGIGTNVGRVINSTLPIFIVLFSHVLARGDTSREI